MTQARIFGDRGKETKWRFERWAAESGHEGEFAVLALFAAALAASSPSPSLESSVPWWEKVTVIVDDKGEQKSCQYQSSLSSAGEGACDEKTSASVKAGGGRAGKFSKVTFERRFSPGKQLDSGQLQPGDELLGRQVMFLTIDDKGAIDSCKVVAATGDMTFAYDCDEAKKEQFRVEAGAKQGRSQGFMTVLAYGHSENIA